MWFVIGLVECCGSSIKFDVIRGGFEEVGMRSIGGGAEKSIR